MLTSAARTMLVQRDAENTFSAASERVPYSTFPLWPPARFEIVAPARFGLVCLRLKGTDAANEELR